MCFKLPTISLQKHLAILVKKLLPRHFKNSQIWLHFDVGKGGGNIYWCRVGALVQWLREETRNQRVVTLNPSIYTRCTFFHMGLL